jgi:hypothetical protein
LFDLTRREACRFKENHVRVRDGMIVVYLYDRGRMAEAWFDVAQLRSYRGCVRCAVRDRLDKAHYELRQQRVPLPEPLDASTLDGDLHGYRFGTAPTTRTALDQDALTAKATDQKGRKE